jgi:hypothetical protein
VDGGTPTLLVKVEGTKRRFILDTGSNVSLIQSGVSGEVVAISNLAPFGVTGDALDVKGEQEVAFHINNVRYEHKFVVCALPTKAAGILGMDFLLKHEAEMNFGKGELKLLDLANLRYGSRKRRGRGAHGTADHSAITIFSTLDNHQVKNKVKVRERNQAPHISLQEAIPFLVKTTSTIRLEPRARQIVLGSLELPKRQEPPRLVCVEPAQIPLEGVFAARTLTYVRREANDRAEQQQGENVTSPNSCPGGSRAGAAVQVMIANFSEEEIILPKATVIGIAEEISENLVASINEDTGFGPQLKGDCRRKESSENFTKFVTEKLAHLTNKERSVMEPVLLRHHYVFHEEGSNDFKGTDLVEHQIIMGDAKPIRRPQYRVPFALRQEMENQIQGMLNKGVIRESQSPWSAPAILAPKKSPTGLAKWRFCCDFRAQNSVTRFNTYPLPVFEETVSTLHGSKYFSVLDCYSGFWQINIKDEHKCKTGFSVPSGHYKFNRLPYGLSNSPSSFQRLMDVVLKNLKGAECWVFIDDVIIFSDTIEEHARRLEHVLQRFEKANLQLQVSKCVFAQLRWNT